jgi:anti-anti-sigma factor
LDRLIIRQDQRGETLVFRLRGPLDIVGAPKLKLELVEAARAGTRDVVLDLAGLGSLDEVGLAVILCEARHLSARGGRLLLVDPSPAVRDVLARTRAAQYLAVVEAA